MAWNWGGMGSGAASGATMGSQIMPGWGTVIGGVAGGIMGGFSGGDEEQEEQSMANDPLAGIRNSLMQIAYQRMDLANQVPGLVKRQKKLIGEEYGVLQNKGEQNIQENIHAVRGFGNNSLEGSQLTDLYGEIGRGRTAAETSAEMQGLQAQSTILGGAANTMAAAGGANLSPAEDYTALMKNLDRPDWMSMIQEGLDGDMFGSPAGGADGSEDQSFDIPSFYSDILKRPAALQYSPGQSSFGYNPNQV